ncbi:MAG: 30S ribosomal protein S12 methylthiotransferase RimO, partial [Helicobacter sp.]|nr:30S ribosomal protein S12 methylthiotransferase RimO [Helicobacter sp.]
SVLDEGRNLAARCYADISFVAQDSSSYLYDKNAKDGLCQLIRALDSVPNLRSARILYLYPSSTNAQLIETIAHSKIVQNYFDMPMQHIADLMLKTMRRGSDAKSHKELLNLMRATPDSFIRTSLIVGHPEEGEAEFEELLAFLETFAFDRVNLFAYSDEEGTRAAKSKHKVAPELIASRIERLNAVIAKSHKAQLQSLVGREIPIVLDTAQREYEALYRARDMRCAPEIDGEILINESLVESPKSGFYLARISEVVGDDLLATLTRPL